MPKPRKKRKPAEAAPAARSRMSVPSWVRWAAITVILMLMLSALVGAVMSAPAKAANSTPSASPSFSPLPSCAPIDTDKDGIINNEDSDIDGDSIANGLDDDMDGDGIANAEDKDPASTTCEQSKAPAQNIVEAKKKQQDDLIRIVSASALVSVAVGYFVLRRRRERSRNSGKVKK